MEENIRLEIASSPEELRYHADNPEKDGRIHILPELLYYLAEKIEKLENKNENKSSISN